MLQDIPIDRLVVKSFNTSYEFNVFSFTLMTIVISPSQCIKSNAHSIMKETIKVEKLKHILDLLQNSYNIYSYLLCFLILHDYIYLNNVLVPRYLQCRRFERLQKIA